nr:hypothetical protein [Tanacetum cinerariifolium]
YEGQREQLNDCVVDLKAHKHAVKSDELEGKPIYDRFASVDHMKAVPSPLTGNYMPPSNIPDIDESQMECSRPNHSDHDSNDSIFSVSASASESRDTIVINCARQEDFPSVCTSSIETDVKSSNTFYLHLIKDCDLHEQRLVKRNAEGNGKLGRRPTGKPDNINRPKPVSACQPNPVFAGKATLACNSIPLSISAGNGILGP